MSRTLLIATTTALMLALTPLQGSAQDAKESEVTPPMAKDEWLKQMSPLLPEVICKGFIEDPVLKKSLEERKITLDICLGYVPAIVNQCKDELYPKIPAMIEDKSAQIWGKALGECMGMAFAKQYLLSPPQ